MNESFQKRLAECVGAAVVFMNVENEFVEVMRGSGRLESPTGTAFVSVRLADGRSAKVAWRPAADVDGDGLAQRLCKALCAQSALCDELARANQEERARIVDAECVKALEEKL